MSPLNVSFCKLALTLHLIYQGVYTSIHVSYQGKPNIKWESTYIYMCRNYYPPSPPQIKCMSNRDPHVLKCKWSSVEKFLSWTFEYCFEHSV